MYKGKKILAIIPARGGSKGLPGKNIRPLCGIPLIGWSIDQAKESHYIDMTFVSTDSPKIADVAESFGIKVPSLRPAELAADNAPSSGFILYTIDYLKSMGLIFDYLVLLEPTSPLRDVDDIDESIEMLFSNEERADSVVGVSLSENTHPDFLVKIGNDGLLKPYKDIMQAVRRQDLERLYFFEGSIYTSKVDAFVQKKSFYHDKTLPYLVPKWKSFEIDDFIDFKIIETLMNLKNTNQLQ